MFGKSTGAAAPKFGVPAAGAGTFKAPSFGAAKPTTAAPTAAGAAGATTAPKFGFAANPAAATTTTTTPTTTLGGAAGAATGAATTAPKFAFAAKPTTATAATPAVGAAATTTTPTTAAGGAAAPAATGAAAIPKFGLGAKTSVSITPAATTPTAAAATTTTTPTAAAGAATTTAGAPKFSMGLTGAKPTTATTATTTTTGTTATTGTTIAGVAKQPVAWKPNVDIPALLKGKTLEEMINEWSSQIDADIFQFTQMAMLVGEWDKKVSSNSKKILDLKQKVDLVESAQSELNKNLELITAQQTQLATVLSALEASVEKWSLTVDLGPQDAERERGYALADDIDVQLNQMSFKLKEMIDRLNASQERASAKDGDHPAFQILQILDSHLNSLAWIDNTSSELGSKLAELQSQFSRRSNSSSMNTDAYSWSSRYY